MSLRGAQTGKKIGLFLPPHWRQLNDCMGGFDVDIVRFYGTPIKGRLHYDNISKREINGDIAAINKTVTL